MRKYPCEGGEGVYSYFHDDRHAVAVFITRIIRDKSAVDFVSNRLSEN
jgi:hypothetical protein